MTTLLSRLLKRIQVSIILIFFSIVLIYPVNIKSAIQSTPCDNNLKMLQASIAKYASLLNTISENTKGSNNVNDTIQLLKRTAQRQQDTFHTIIENPSTFDLDKNNCEEYEFIISFRKSILLGLINIYKAATIGGIELQDEYYIFWSEQIEAYCDAKNNYSIICELNKFDPSIDVTNAINVVIAYTKEIEKLWKKMTPSLQEQIQNDENMSMTHACIYGFLQKNASEMEDRIKHIVITNDVDLEIQYINIRLEINKLFCELPILLHSLNTYSETEDCINNMLRIFVGWVARESPGSESPNPNQPGPALKK